MVWKESTKNMVLIRPHRATHAVLKTPDGKKAVVAIADLDTLVGSTGVLTWMRLTPKKREKLNKISFDGSIERIESDYRKPKRTG